MIYFLSGKLKNTVLNHSDFFSFSTAQNREEFVEKIKVEKNLWKKLVKDIGGKYLINSLKDLKMTRKSG